VEVEPLVAGLDFLEPTPATPLELDHRQQEWWVAEGRKQFAK
jgi:hypothetical protein